MHQLRRSKWQVTARRRKPRRSVVPQSAGLVGWCESDDRDGRQCPGSRARNRRHRPLFGQVDVGCTAVVGGGAVLFGRRLGACPLRAVACQRAVDFRQADRRELVGAGSVRPVRDADLAGGETASCDRGASCGPGCRYRGGGFDGREVPAEAADPQTVALISRALSIHPTRVQSVVMASTAWNTSRAIRSTVRRGAGPVWRADERP